MGYSFKVEKTNVMNTLKKPYKMRKRNLKLENICTCNEKHETVSSIGQKFLETRKQMGSSILYRLDKLHRF